MKESFETHDLSSLRFRHDIKEELCILTELDCIHCSANDESMRCILHIGSPKTGTTSLQKALSLNEALLKNREVVYPKAGRVFPSRRFARHVGFRFAMSAGDGSLGRLAESLQIISPQQQQRYTQDFIDNFDAEISNMSKNSTVIISDEDLYVFSNKDLASQAHKFLRARFSDIQVISYLRRPDRYVTSAYSQTIKMGAIHTFEAYLENYLNSSLYFGQLHPWVDEFGSDKVTLRCFEPERLHGSDIIDDFIYWAELPVEGLEKQRANRGMSALGCEVLRQINMRFQPKQDLNPSVLSSKSMKLMSDIPIMLRNAVLENFSGGESILSEKSVENLREVFARDHARLTEALDLAEGTDLYLLDQMTSGCSANQAEISEHAEKIALALLSLYSKAD